MEVPPNVTVNVRSETGGINLDRLKSDSTVYSKAGRVQVTDTSGKVSARTASGAILGIGLTAATTEVATEAGTLDLTFAKAPSTVSATSSAGNIKIKVPNDTTYTVTAETAVGTKKVDVKQDPASTHVIKAKTMVGSINVSGVAS